MLNNSQWELEQIHIYLVPWYSFIAVTPGGKCLKPFPAEAVLQVDNKDEDEDEEEENEDDDDDEDEEDVDE